MEMVGAIIDLKEFKKRMNIAGNSDDYINEQIMVIESTIEKILNKIESE